MINETEWEKFSCTVPTNEGPFDLQCQKLTVVRHTVHIPDALIYIEKGNIQSGIVYDVSRLNRTRLQVIWMSANEWSNGSIYGTVEFLFNWENLINNRTIYWVEAIDIYSPPAYRFLLSDRNLNGSNLISPYDPEIDNGPLKKINGKWYWNGRYTSEFMIESNILLEECIGINFIKHNNQICRLFDSNCTERNESPIISAGRVLAKILGYGNISQNHLFLNFSDDSSKFEFNPSANFAIEGICQLLNFGNDCKGTIDLQLHCISILRGALTLLSGNLRIEALKLISQLKSRKVFGLALQDIIQIHFGIQDVPLITNLIESKSFQ